MVQVIRKKAGGHCHLLILGERERYRGSQYHTSSTITSILSCPSEAQYRYLYLCMIRTDGLEIKDDSACCVYSTGIYYIALHLVPVGNILRAGALCPTLPCPALPDLMPRPASPAPEPAQVRRIILGFDLT